MTDDQINAAIAEACGWSMEDGVWVWNANGIDCTYYELWDWANDLNAMHHAEKVLGKEKIDDYCDLLWPKGFGWFHAIHTTARQRAEAFLRTLGKWEEVQP